MNSELDLLKPYPFQKLALILKEHPQRAALRPVNLSIGEPRHATPDFIKDALTRGLDGLSVYPATLGAPALREAIAAWIQRHHGLAIDPATQVLPVNGTREALFALAQAVVDRKKNAPVVVMPNPFYQIYEGASLLSGAEPYFFNQLAENGYANDWKAIPEAIWARTQLIYVCSPGNPTGRVMTLDEWKDLFELSDKYGFVIAADECYYDIYPDEAQPPLGSIAAARMLGRDDLKNLISFASLSKRSNVPGMRSGFVAGDAAVMKKFLLYRTYQGGAMSPAVSTASIAAWNDEAHVIENRRLYQAKFEAMTPILQEAADVQAPQAGFYYWMKTPVSDIEFACRLHADYNVTVLPGSLLARDAHGVNPGQDLVRIAIVAPHDDCVEAAGRIRDCFNSFK